MYLRKKFFPKTTPLHLMYVCIINNGISNYTPEFRFSHHTRKFSKF
ncbi:hypothetical protein BAPKO_4533 (plasmid) [Borreliella afzelii PKo]|nr:hypothetical protein BAPKO_4533 [Borreliella afzelii PKo]